MSATNGSKKRAGMRLDESELGLTVDVAETLAARGIDSGEIALRRSDVAGVRAEEAFVGRLLEDVGRPAGVPGQRVEGQDRDAYVHE